MLLCRLLLFFALIVPVTSWAQESPDRTSAEAGRPQKKPFISVPASCPSNRIVFVTWNLGNFGKSKTPQVVDRMADILREADIVVGQEVSVGGAGAQASSYLRDTLSRRGAAWDMILSDRTVPESNGVERYVAFWRSDKMVVNRRAASLMTELQDAIIREPYRLLVRIGNRDIVIYNFHAVPTDKDPVQEMKAFSGAIELMQARNVIIAGDFNLSGEVTDPIMRIAAFDRGHIRELTSLKQEVGKGGEYRYRQYDNIYTKGALKVCGAGVIDFPSILASPLDDAQLREMRHISDHLPAWIAFVPQ